MERLAVLHVVRRYGRVGGMESYVWELTRALAEKGVNVAVLCTCCKEPPPPGVKVHALTGLDVLRPRWLGYLLFSYRVSRWLASHGKTWTIIHSHERTGVHHVTTFHGPPFAEIRRHPFWKRLSARVFANLWLEHRELCGSQVCAVVPNSLIIEESLREFYPCAREKLWMPVPPGVGEVESRQERVVPQDGGVIGFVGREWKRKGLDTAVRIVNELRRKRKNLIFLVAGPKPEDIRHLFAGWDKSGYQLLGDVRTESFYSRLDLLLHPARMEPYGMVVAEAMKAGVPVLVSDRCGVAKEVDAGGVVDLQADIGEWVRRCDALLGSSIQADVRSWEEVAADYLQCYSDVLEAMSSC